MENLTLDYQLFYKQQKGEDTDCSFVFDVAPEKVIHGHKLIISAASKYFETNFKPEWEKNAPILITTFDFAVFEKLIVTIYLNKYKFESLEEALELYEAAHFYQTERVLDIVRAFIPTWCVNQKILAISSLTKTAWKFHDLKLIAFLSKFFMTNTYKILEDPDFLNITPEHVNWLYQFDDLSVYEVGLVEALEKYLAANPKVYKLTLKPAIGAIRFLSLPRDEVLKTTLLSQIEKDFLLGEESSNIFYLSKRKQSRTIKSFFSLLPSNIQVELIHKCGYHYNGVLVTDKPASINYPGYEKIAKLTICYGSCTKSATDVIKILKEYQKAAYVVPQLGTFANIDDVLTNIYYV